MKKEIKYPEFEEWHDANYTLYRTFELTSGDIEILQDVLKKEYPNPRGNDIYTINRLNGVLKSMKFERYDFEILRRKYPKTYELRFWFSKLKKYFHRRFKTKHFRRQVVLCNMAHSVVNKKG